MRISESSQINDVPRDGYVSKFGMIDFQTRIEILRNIFDVIQEIKAKSRGALTTHQSLDLSGGPRLEAKYWHWHFGRIALIIYGSQHKRTKWIKSRPSLLQTGTEPR